jgi:hypothetical protein
MRQAFTRSDAPSPSTMSGQSLPPTAFTNGNLPAPLISAAPPAPPMVPGPLPSQDQSNVSQRSIRAGMGTEFIGNNHANAFFPSPTPSSLYRLFGTAPNSPFHPTNPFSNPSVPQPATPPQQFPPQSLFQQQHPMYIAPPGSWVPTDLTAFSGDDTKAKAFIEAVELAFLMNSAFFMAPASKVLYAANNCQGNPRSWIKALIDQADPIIHNWAEFKVEFLSSWARFESPSETQSKLLAIKQAPSTSVAAYATQFRSLADKLRYNGCEQPEHLLIHIFNQGLRTGLKEKVEEARIHSYRTGNWPTLRELQSTAQAFEHTIPSGNHPSRPVSVNAVGMSGGAGVVVEGKYGRGISQEQRVANKEAADRAERMGGCRFCKKEDHKISACEVFKEKFGRYWTEDYNQNKHPKA